MVLWILLGSAIFLMILLYLIIGPHKVYLTSAIYGAIAIAAATLLIVFYKDLYIFDLFALLMPYIILMPVHITIKYFINSYVLQDDQRSQNYISAVYNKVNNVLWIIEAFLLVLLTFALVDAIYDGFDGLSISMISVVGGLMIIILFIVIFQGYNKKFNYVIVVGDDKKIYKFKTNKKRFFVKQVLGNEVKVYPRGIYFEEGEITYLFYIKDNIKVIETFFKPYKSELFSYLKKYIESSHDLEMEYNNYIEMKQNKSN
ncbi:hypothetical protein [Acholeplasma hippikon]|uniref:Uncharacterized protein n=1 Tax=Acholeplasma hippikon TaxID=264636 RepID=A0A449BIU1_9MOLU|nr:hypothetical protein [Acholeplasma hippikon]VEU82376.1 Uncharacterised protein [Acholeplasma hippikon]